MTTYDKDLFANFTQYDLDSETFSAQHKIEAILLLIPQGILKNSDIINLLTLAMQKYVERISREKAAGRQAFTNDSALKLCREIINYIENNAHDLSYDLKKLSLLSALILQDPIILGKIAQTSSKDEPFIIDFFLKTLATPPTILIVREEKNILNASKNIELGKVFLKISTLLQNTALCIKLLKSLEEKLSLRFAAAGLDPQFHLQQADDIIFFNLPWPLKSTPDLPKTENILNSVLLEKERQYDINQDEDSPISFAGFVEEDVANQYVKNGHIFTEYNYIGNLLHGKYSHRLQWSIVITAIEEKLLDIGNISIKDLLIASANVWTYVFDRYDPWSPHILQQEHYGFSSPFYLHSALLFLKNELPCLSLTARKTFFQSLQVISQQQKQDTPITKICAEYDIQAGSFENLYDKISVNQYYQSKSHYQLRIQHQTFWGGAAFFKKRIKPASCVLQNDSSATTPLKAGIQ